MTDQLLDFRPGWDDWAMSIAFAVATRADCRRALVGAVMLNSDHRVISTGYNGTAAGRDGCLAGNCPRGRHTYHELAREMPYDKPGDAYCIATHAEMNALLYADPLHLRDASMYVTIRPCQWCYKVIANTMVSRIIFPAAEMTVEGYYRAKTYNIPIELTVDMV